MYTREAGKALSAYSAEQVGLPAVTSALKTIQLVQQHRGLSALALSGTAGADDKRSDKQREADAAVAALDSFVKAADNPAITTLWGSARSEWDALRGAVSAKSITPPESYAAHVKLLAKLLKCRFQKATARKSEVGCID